MVARRAFNVKAVAVLGCGAGSLTCRDLTVVFQQPRLKSRETGLSRTGESSRVWVQPAACLLPPWVQGVVEEQQRSLLLPPTIAPPAASAANSQLSPSSASSTTCSDPEVRTKLRACPSQGEIRPALCCCFQVRIQR